MTLIEVVTGLVILGTVLASLAVARGRFALQWAEADRKLAATRALDAKIAEWMSSTPPRVPFRSEGPLPAMRGCIWRTQASRTSEADRLSAIVVRVEAISHSTRAATPVALASVDLLVHVSPISASRPTTRRATP